MQPSGTHVATLLPACEPRVVHLTARRRFNPLKTRRVRKHCCGTVHEGTADLVASRTLLCSKVRAIHAGPVDSRGCWWLTRILGRCWSMRRFCRFPRVLQVVESSCSLVSGNSRFLVVFGRSWTEVGFAGLDCVPRPACARSDRIRFSCDLRCVPSSRAGRSTHRHSKSTSGKARTESAGKPRTPEGTYSYN